MTTLESSSTAPHTSQVAATRSLPAGGGEFALLKRKLKSKNCQKLMRLQKRDVDGKILIALVYRKTWMIL